jgi:hypothetical protein
VAFATFSSITAYLNSRLTGRTNWSDIIVTAGLWLIFAVLTPIPYAFSRRFPLRTIGPARAVPMHALGALLLSVAWTSTGVLLSVLLGRRPVRVTVLYYFLSSLLSTLPYCVFLYFAALGCI